jgi:flagellar FliL protein
MKTKLSKIFSIVSQVMMFISMTFISILTLATAYVVFAPDVFPKPFYLVYADTPMGSLPAGYTLADGAQPSNEQNTTTKGETTTELLPGQSIMIPMTTKIINLADTGGHKYIRLTVALEFAPDNPEYKTLPAEEAAAYLTEFQTKVGNNLPAMDDVIITLLSTKTFEQLYTADGKEALRTEVKDAINNRMTDFHVISVYFTEFVVQ